MSDPADAPADAASAAPEAAPVVEAPAEMPVVEAKVEATADLNVQVGDLLAVGGVVGEVFGVSFSTVDGDTVQIGTASAPWIPLVNFVRLDR